MTRNKRTTLEKTWETQAGTFPGGAEHPAGQGPLSGNTVPSSAFRTEGEGGADGLRALGR